MIRRHITGNLLQALADTPVVLVNGARQTGKSTLVQSAELMKPSKCQFPLLTQFWMRQISPVWQRESAKSGPTLPLGSGGSRGDARRHPSPSPCYTANCRSKPTFPGGADQGF